MKREYFWDDGSGERGPFTTDEIRQLGATGVIRPEHRIRHEPTGRSSLAVQIGGLVRPRTPRWRQPAIVALSVVCSGAVVYGITRIAGSGGQAPPQVVPTDTTTSSQSATVPPKGPAPVEDVMLQDSAASTSGGPRMDPPNSATAAPADHAKLDALIDKAFAAEPAEQTPPPKRLRPNRLTAEEIFRQVSPGVVRVETEDSEGNTKSQGSGFFIDEVGSVVTNYHVLEGAATASVILSNNASLDVVGVLAASKEDDVVVLVTAGRGVHALEWRDDQSPAIGSKVFAIGSPSGLDNTLSDGVLSGVREEGGRRYFQTTAAISPGSSGGPLLDEHGKVLGINTFTIRGGQNLNFAVPLERIHAIVEPAVTPPVKIRSIPEVTGVTAATPKGRVSPLRQRLDDGLPFQARVDLMVSDDASGGIIESAIKRELRKLSDVLVTDVDPQFALSVVVLPDEVGGQTSGYFISWVVTSYDFRTEDKGRMKGSVSDHLLMLRGTNVLDGGLVELVARFDTKNLEPVRRAFNRLRDQRERSK